MKFPFNFFIFPALCRKSGILGIFCSFWYGFRSICICLEVFRPGREVDFGVGSSRGEGFVTRELLQSRKRFRQCPLLGISTTFGDNLQGICKVCVRRVDRHPGRGILRSRPAHDRDAEPNPSEDTTMASMNAQEMAAMIAKLEAENKALRAVAEAKITLKLTDKGGISLYGLGRWPVTLYAKQWATLLGHSKAIESFIAANRPKIDVFEARFAEAKAEAKTTSEAEALAAAVDARLAVA